ncbi:hypothetical protein ACH41E_28220 [Streptomyces sp. NPDC020412]|uniref:hypothetical protein n=1 Tax=Streptomyces sp. NPDC020412 TaxID=3365073 RepID=UPI00379BCAF5
MEHQNKPEAPETPETPEAAAEAEAAADGGSAEAPAVRRRPRGATAVLLAVASVVGLVGGTAVGYGVQADREPKPLPPLSQPGLAYPAKPLPADQRPTALTAAEDHRVKTEGDLRKLLLPKPAGARSVGAEWLDDGLMDVRSYARGFTDEQHTANELLREDMRRGAGARWTKGDRTWVVHLVQFRSYEGAEAFASRAHFYDSEVVGDGAGDQLAGTESSRTYLFKVQRESGSKPLYRARAALQRGDIMAEINVWDSKPIGKKEIRTLAEQQLERL